MATSNLEIVPGTFYQQKKKDDGLATVVALFLLALLLCIANYMVWKKKNESYSPLPFAPQTSGNTYSHNHPGLMPPTSPAALSPSGPPSIQKLSQSDQKLVQDVQALKEATQLMWDRRKEESERNYLVGVLSQHNFTVIQRNQPMSDMVFLNKDWTLTGYPNTLELSGEDKAFIWSRVKAK